MKIIRTSLLQNFERAKQFRGVFLFGQPSDVKQEFPIDTNAEPRPRSLLVGSVRAEDVDVNTEAQNANVPHAPITKHVSQSLGRDQCCCTLIVKFTHVSAGKLHHPTGRRFTEYFCAALE